MQVINSARANATHNHGLDPDRLLVGKKEKKKKKHNQLKVFELAKSNVSYSVVNSVQLYTITYSSLLAFFCPTAEAFVGKGFFKKRISYHGKGKCGIKVRPECRLTVVVREITAEEEAEIARLRVSNFRKLTKRERQLVPHQLIETTPRWSRKRRDAETMSITTT